jgi:hypothetical protein
MRKINISLLRKDLKEIPVEESMKKLIIGNAEMHNYYLEKYVSGEKINPYIIWQLNTQVFKQLLDLKKLTKKANEEETDFVAGLKNRLMGDDDIEKR